MNKNTKIYLSPPNIDHSEIENVVQALNSGWISPFGSYTIDFTNKLSNYFNKNILLTNSGTSSIHLALKLTKIKEGDYVLCSNFTFAATAFPILYEKAIPVFIGSEKETWNMSPEFLHSAIEDLNRKDIKPKVLIIAHIYGMPAQMDKITDICKDNNIIIIEDAAEALGSFYHNKPLGSMGNYGIISFNGNKIITTSQGGALILPNKKSYNYAEKLAFQAKEKVDYYKHNELGYNYSTSNILAALGCAQFDKLEKKVKRRRLIFDYYLSNLEKRFTIDYQKELNHSFSNRWLSSFIFPTSLNKKIKSLLEKNNIESRFLWNPLNKQKVFKNFSYYGDSFFENRLFKNGLCLPSGDNLNDEELNKIITIIDKNI